MSEGEKNRLLPIVAGVLVVLALAAAVFLVFLRVPPGRQALTEALMAADLAYEDGNRYLFRQELLRASRHAVSAANWKRILMMAAQELPNASRPSDYRLFTVLAGRAAASLPGNEDFQAYWAWALTRGGNDKKALRAAGVLAGTRWDFLYNEIYLKKSIEKNGGSLEQFLADIEKTGDPDFLSQAAALTGSAELTADAALMYMRLGLRDKAYSEARRLMDGNRHWNRPDTMRRTGIVRAMAAVAQDAGYMDDSVRWLSLQVEENRRRRALSWQNMELLGQLHWENYQMTNAEQSLLNARDAWAEAMDILREEGNGKPLPDNAWKLWLNMAVVEQSVGNILASHRLLDEALELFPESSEVKAAWALEMNKKEPALARRLIRQASRESDDPVLEITHLALEPEFLSPRLYEGRLWSLFEAVVKNGSTIDGEKARLVTEYLLDYMRSRNDFTSIEVAVERYIKAYPEQKWILAWKLASDASRGMGIINLVPREPSTLSVYSQFKEMAYATANPLALYDSALFALMCARELTEARELFFDAAFGKQQESGISSDAVILAVLESLAIPQERIKLKAELRSDLKEERKRLLSSGRQGIQARAQAGSILNSLISQLNEDARNALDAAMEKSENLTDKNKKVLNNLGEEIL